VAPSGWVKYARARLYEWTIHTSTGADPDTFKPRLEQGLVDDLIRPGDVLTFVRRLRYKRTPVQAGIMRGMERGYAPYNSTVQKYVTGSCYPESMDLRRSLLTRVARGLLETFDGTSDRFHVRTFVALMECFFNRTETSALSTFLLTPDSVATIVAHVGRADGPVPATHTANLPIMVWVDNCFWVVYLDHVAAVVRDVYTAFVHWMWLFVHVAQPMSNEHVRLREALRGAHEFLSDDLCALYARAPGDDSRGGASASASASAKPAPRCPVPGASTGEQAVDDTATMVVHQAKRMRLEAIEQTLEVRTQVRIDSTLRLRRDALLG
jgi:hypothetical protein